MPQRPERQPGFEQRIDERGLHRLHFSVPRPMARVNLGMPWFERLRGTTFDNATRRFGYRGVSLQSEYHLFTHIAKDTLIHTGKITQLQTGKNWLQYTGGSQWIATKKDVTFAASKRVTIVAGAGQGPKSPIPFGMDVRPDPYNNLDLHYCVDSVMMGVYEFLVGRRRRTMNSFVKPMFHSEEGLLNPDQGFYATLRSARSMLGPGLPGIHGIKNIFGDGTSSNGEEPEGNGLQDGGYGKPYFTAFDPYAKKSADGVAGFLDAMQNAISDGKRAFDVISKIGDEFENLPLIYEANVLAKSMGDLGSLMDEVVQQAEHIGGLNTASSDGVPMADSLENEFDAVTQGMDVPSALDEFARRQSSRRSAEIRLRRPAEGWPAANGEGFVVVDPQTVPPSTFGSVDAGASSAQVAAVIAEAFGAEGRFVVLVDGPTGDIIIRSTNPLSEGDNLSFLRIGGTFFRQLLGDDAALPATSRVPVGTPYGLGDSEDFRQTLAFVSSLDVNPTGYLAPIVRGCRQVVDSLDKIVTMVEDLGKLGGDVLSTGSVPSALGLFAKDGISVGTTDRYVSAAGKGYVFIADGGTGQPDVKKYIMPFEHTLEGMKSSGKGLVGLDKAPVDTSTQTASIEAHAQGGFTVLSNSTTSLVTRTALDLMAIGTSKEGQTLEGRGVARLLATHSTEVAAHDRVTIAATAGADFGEDSPPERATTTGEVEVLGTTIRIGSSVPCCGHQDWWRNTTLAWPGANPNDTRTFVDQPRSVAPATETVRVRASSTVDLSTGTGASDLEYLTAIHNALEGEAQTVRQSREDHSLEPEGTSDEERAAKEAMQQFWLELENDVQARLGRAEAALGAARTRGDMVASLWMAGEVMRFGFCSAGASEECRGDITHWGPHVEVTPRGIRLLSCGRTGHVSLVEVNEQRSRIQGDTPGVEIVVGREVRAPGLTC